MAGRYHCAGGNHSIEPIISEFNALDCACVLSLGGSVRLSLCLLRLCLATDNWEALQSRPDQRLAKIAALRRTWWRWQRRRRPKNLPRSGFNYFCAFHYGPRFHFCLFTRTGDISGLCLHEGTGHECCTG